MNKIYLIIFSIVFIYSLNLASADSFGNGNANSNGFGYGSTTQNGIITFTEEDPFYFSNPLNFINLTSIPKCNSGEFLTRDMITGNILCDAMLPAGGGDMIAYQDASNDFTMTNSFYGTAYFWDSTSFFSSVLFDETVTFTKSPIGIPTYNATYNAITNDVNTNRSLWFSTYNSTYAGKADYTNLVLNNQSNVFTGNQNISGNLTITENITALGYQCFNPACTAYQYYNGSVLITKVN